jgi:hypothetical protein
MKKKLPLVILVLALAGAGFFAFWQSQGLSAASDATRVANAQLSAAEAKNKELEKRAEASQKEIERLKGQASEVFRLRNEVTMLKRENAQLEKDKKALAEKAARLGERAADSATQAQVQTIPANVLPGNFASVDEMVRRLAPLRNKALNGGLTDEEKAYLQQLQPQLAQLERMPAEFAAFQSAMIQNATGINDPERLQQIENIIQKTYENAVSRGLDIPSFTPENPSNSLNPTWDKQREQLDRRATGAVQKVLTPDERANFDRVFTGVMGVDLGLEANAPVTTTGSPPAAR